MSDHRDCIIANIHNLCMADEFATRDVFNVFFLLLSILRFFAAFMTNTVSRGTKIDSSRLNKRQSSKNCCSKIYFQSIVCRESTRRRRLGVFLPPPTSFPAPDRLQCGVLAQGTETNICNRE